MLEIFPTDAITSLVFTLLLKNVFKMLVNRLTYLQRGQKLSTLMICFLSQNMRVIGCCLDLYLFFLNHSVNCTDAVFLPGSH